MGDRWGYIDKEGKILINPQFELAFPFVDGLALVYSNNRIGFINKTGKFEINPQFSEVSSDYLRMILKETQRYNYSEIVYSKPNPYQYSEPGVRYVPVPTRPDYRDYDESQDAYAPAASAPVEEEY